MAQLNPENISSNQVGKIKTLFQQELTIIDVKFVPTRYGEQVYIQYE